MSAETKASDTPFTYRVTKAGKMRLMIELPTDDPFKVYIYRENGSISVVESFANKLTGEDVLPGFEFNLAQLKK